MYKKFVLGSTSGREKLDCDSVSVEASADLGTSECGMALQSCPELW